MGTARFAAAGLALLLAACAGVPVPAGVLGNRVTIAGTEYRAEWTLPPGEPAALLTLQHGFARQCSHLRQTARQIADRGLLVLCLDADMAHGNPALADGLAQALAGGWVGADGRALPARIIVGGHSAGGAFAARLGWKLDALAPARLLGALLLDPVAVAGFEDELQAVSAGGRRPVLALTANASGCNAQNNADPALRALRSGFVGLQLVDGSTHVDAEGGDSSWLATAACGQPLPANVELLRTLAAQWAADIAAGSPSAPFYPGGSFVDALVSRGAVRLIAPP